MTDPTDALVSFQKALLDGAISLQAGALYPDVFVHLDQPTPGVNRFTYVRLDGKTVIALAMLVNIKPLNDLPCFQIGVAVPPAYRNKGYGKGIIEAAMAELKNGLSRNKIPEFYVEGIVSVDNEPSKRVSAATISVTPTSVTDEFSGQPALRYVRKV